MFEKIIDEIVNTALAYKWYVIALIISSIVTSFTVAGIKALRKMYESKKGIDEKLHPWWLVAFVSLFVALGISFTMKDLLDGVIMFIAYTVFNFFTTIWFYEKMGQKTVDKFQEKIESTINEKV